MALGDYEYMSTIQLELLVAPPLVNLLFNYIKIYLSNLNIKSLLLLSRLSHVRL